MEGVDENTEPQDKTRTDETAMVAVKSLGMSTGAIVGLVIIIFLILLLIVDVTCYLKNRCGIIMCIQENICAKAATERDRQITVEEGDDDAKETQPLAEKVKDDGEIEGRGADNQADTVDDEKKQPLLDEEKNGPELTELLDPEKMDEKEPEDKDEVIAEIPVPEAKEAEEDHPAADVVQAEEATDQPSEDPAPQGELC